MKENVKKIILNRSLETPEEVRKHVEGFVDLKCFKYVEGDLTLNMKELYKLVDYVMSTDDDEVLSLVKEAAGKRFKTPLIGGYKFRKFWRKRQAEWAEIKDPLKILLNGMYFPFNRELFALVKELDGDKNYPVAEALTQLQVNIAGINIPAYIEEVERQLA